MKQTQRTVTVLEPQEGHYITQADPATPIELRTLARKLYLSPAERPESWRQITADEAEAYRQQADEARAKAAAEDNEAIQPAAPAGR